jgi:hypothetical protein
MTITWLGFDSLLPESRMCLSPDKGGDAGDSDVGDGGDDGASTGDDSGDSTDDKTFTQEELNEIVKKRLATEGKKQARELRAKEKQAKALEAKFETLEKELTELKSDKEDKKPDTIEGQIAAQERRHKKELEALTNRLDQAEVARRKAEIARRESDRDRQINEALIAAQCHDPAGGYKYFVNDAEWDEDEEVWHLNAPDGTTVDILTGVKTYLPDYFRQSFLSEGGAGTSSGDPSRNRTMKKLNEERKKLEKTETVGRNRPSAENLLEYRRQLGVVKQLEEELGVSK